ncbi:hypothetical protein DENSPDRAFT_886732 [Dentipellis sp. KUC8613]|nr:hypothetical protein DENSPDRAFT_886732 [Dentipellis sp. KUC8613]
MPSIHTRQSRSSNSSTKNRITALFGKVARIPGHYVSSVVDNQGQTGPPLPSPPPPPLPLPADNQPSSQVHRVSPTSPTFDPAALNLLSFDVQSRLSTPSLDMNPDSFLDIVTGDGTERLTGMHDIDELLKIPLFPRSTDEIRNVFRLAELIHDQRSSRMHVAEVGMLHCKILADLWARELEVATSDVNQAEIGMRVLRSIMQYPSAADVGADQSLVQGGPGEGGHVKG